MYHKKKKFKQNNVGLLHHIILNSRFQISKWTAIIIFQKFVRDYINCVIFLFLMKTDLPIL